MSRAYKKALESNSELDVRAFCRVGVFGPTMTEQAHKKECDVNQIIKKYDKTGLITHVNKIEAQFGDMSGADFKTMMDKVANAKSLFASLPSDIRKRFDQSTEKFLAFMESPDNRAEAIKLGLIKAEYPADKDGLGEHMTAEDQEVRDEEIVEDKD